MPIAVFRPAAASRSRTVEKRSAGAGRVAPPANAFAERWVRHAVCGGLMNEYRNRRLTTSNSANARRPWPGRARQPVSTLSRTLGTA